MSNLQSQFSAAPSLLGYLYQIQYALYESLVKLKKDVNFAVSVETLDDILFESGNDNKELFQTKLHKNISASLTDSSVDLWKSIRIWSENLIKNKFNKNFSHFLITTSSANEGTIAYYLKPGEARNVEGAIKNLKVIAQTSKSIDNSTAYQVFKSLNDNELFDLFSKVVIFDSSPDILGVEKAIREELLHTAERKYIDSLINRLEGWWISRIIQQLTSTEAKVIIAEEILAEISRLREEYKIDNLPIYDDIITEIIDDNVFQDRMFIKQLNLLQVGNNRIMIAIRDYYRAFTQRSRWLREDLLYVGELDDYERRLIEEWEIHFEQMRDELGKEASEDEKIKLARKLYNWIEQGNLLQIRPRVTEPFISRGSYHILADNLRAGWHIEFLERLQLLLGVK